VWPSVLHSCFLVPVILSSCVLTRIYPWDIFLEKINNFTGESPELKPCTYSQLICEKEARIYNGEETAHSISGAGKTGQLNVKEGN